MEITVYECEFCKRVYSNKQNLQNFNLYVNSKSLNYNICIDCSKLLDKLIEEMLSKLIAESIIIY